MRSWAPDLIVLYLMLPSKNGLDVCRTLREESEVPIIMLTARAEEADRIVGLRRPQRVVASSPRPPLSGEEARLALR